MAEDLHQDEDMHNQDLNGLNTDDVQYNVSKEIDSERGRGAYSFAEKAYTQFNEVAAANARANGALAQQQQANIAFDAQDKQQTLRHNDELFHQSLRHVDDLHTVRLQILSGANTVDKMDARATLDTVTGLMQALLDKLAALTPPTSTK